MLLLAAAESAAVSKLWHNWWIVGSANGRLMLLEYQLRELCGVQPLRRCSERARPNHQGVEPVPTGTLKWCTTTPEGIADPEGIVEWCDESLNIECQVDTKDVKLTIRTA